MEGQWLDELVSTSHGARSTSSLLFLNWLLTLSFGLFFLQAGTAKRRALDSLTTFLLSLYLEGRETRLDLFVFVGGLELILLQLSFSLPLRLVCIGILELFIYI